MKFLYHSIIALQILFCAVYAGSATAQSDDMRIISLSPQLTRICADIGLRDNIIALTDDCALSRYDNQITKIGTPHDIKIDLILDMNPQLILAEKSSNRSAQLDLLRDAKLNVAVIKCSSYEELYPAIRAVGNLTEKQQEANRLIEKLKKRINDIQNIIRDEPSPRVLLLFGTDTLKTCKTGSLADTLITMAGGINVAVQPDNNATSSPDLKTLLRQNPQIIFEARTIDYNKIDPLGDIYARWAKWPSVEAVKNRRIYVIPPEPLTVPGPQLVSGLEIICAAMYPHKSGEILQKQSKNK